MYLNEFTLGPVPEGGGNTLIRSSQGAKATAALIRYAWCD